MKEILVATDGSALRNPNGPAGWAWFVDDARWDYGSVEKGSNQLAEGLALYAALRALPKDVPLRIQTDSQFWVNVLGENGRAGWRANWKRNNWVKPDGRPPANLTLLRELDRVILTRTAPLTLQWVKGHNGHLMNGIADALCTWATSLRDKGQAVKGPGWRARSQQLLYEYELPAPARKLLEQTPQPKTPRSPARAPVAPQHPASPPAAPRPATAPAARPTQPSKSPRVSTGRGGEPEPYVPSGGPARRVDIVRKRTAPGYRDSVLNPPPPTQRRKAQEAREAAARRTSPTRRRARVDNSITTFMDDDDDVIPTVTSKDPLKKKGQVCTSCGGLMNPITSECRCSF